MSYSRWSNSFWYTFWSSTGFEPENMKMENEVFQICDVSHGMDFLYKELKSNIEDCLTRVKEKYNTESEIKFCTDYKKKEYETHTCHPLVLEDHLLDELRSYMEKFIRDVEEEYNNGQ
jgi:hypothetical protein